MVIVYTLFGGLYSVAYTDVVQLGFIFIGLWLAVPFALQHESVGSIVTSWPEWRGQIDGSRWVEWLDSMLLLIFGGIPWQVRSFVIDVHVTRNLPSVRLSLASFRCTSNVFSRRSQRRKPCISRSVPLSGVSFWLFLRSSSERLPNRRVRPIERTFCFVFFVSLDWSMTDYDINKDINSPEATKLILPLVLLHLCPKFIAFIGLGAVSAAVMSSADSSVLSASSMFARNVWKLVFRNHVRLDHSFSRKARELFA